MPTQSAANETGFAQTTGLTPAVLIEQPTSDFGELAGASVIRCRAEVLLKSGDNVKTIERVAAFHVDGDGVISLAGQEAIGGAPGSAALLLVGVSFSAHNDGDEHAIRLNVTGLALTTIDWFSILQSRAFTP